LKSFAPLLCLIFFLALWEGLILVFALPRYLLPSPRLVANTMLEQSAELWMAFLLTGSAALLGFLLSLFCGFIISVGFALSPWLKKGLFPYAVFFQTVPIIAIAPLIILWLGHGYWGVVIVALILSIFPIISGTTVGLTQCSPEHLELFQLHEASTLQRLLKLQIPNAWPEFIAGARISAGLCVIGAIVGEFSSGFGTQHFGLGYLILFTSGQLKTDYLFACILCSTLLGFIAFTSTNIFGSLFLKKFHLDTTQSTP
jgi:NitT/TauT family transport system permease protein